MSVTSILYFTIGKIGVDFGKFTYDYFKDFGLKLGIISAAVLHLSNKTFGPYKDIKLILNSIFTFVNICLIVMSVGVINLILKQYGITYSFRINIILIIASLITSAIYSLGYKFLSKPQIKDKF